MTVLFDQLLSDIQWEPVVAIAPDDDPCQYRPTQRGVLKIDQFELHCYQSPTGEVAFDVEDLERFLRGCPFCNHPSHCPGCNSSEEERDRPRVGFVIEGTLGGFASPPA